MTANMLQAKLEMMLNLYTEIKREIQIRDKVVYERWKAGGFIVDSDIYSTYPSIEIAVESLQWPQEEQSEEHLEEDEQTAQDAVNSCFGYYDDYGTPGH